MFANGHYPAPNVAHGLLLAIDKDAARRAPYSDDELQRIFALPVFTGTRSTDKAFNSGEHQVNDWRFWIPAICLYSGARLGEIAQLRAIDVKKVGGHWAFHITDEGESQEVKTSGSRRVVLNVAQY